MRMWSELILLRAGSSMGYCEHGHESSGFIIRQGI